nr:type II secretion system protein GspF [Desulfobacterales bacterium]
MPVYEYSALNRKGKNVHGIIDADNPFAARERLRNLGLFPVEVSESSPRKRSISPGGLPFSHIVNRVKSSHVSIMTRQLSTLLGAGIPLVSSLEALMLQTKNPVLKRTLAQVKESVNEGDSFADALSQHPGIFSPLYVNVVRAGEASGALEPVLKRLAEFSENQETLKGRIRSALAYPIFMFLVGFVVLFFLITYVVPNIVRIFQEMDQVLPLPTLILIGTSRFLRSFWWLLSLMVVGGIIGILYLKESRKGRYIWDKYRLLIPILGNLYQTMALARLARSLSTLLSSGVTLLTALEIAQRIVDNLVIADDIGTAITEVQEGKALATPLSQSRWFPPVVVQMVSIGEQTGELDDMLEKIADTYEREIEATIMTLTSLLEPVMILLMGITIGFIVISILIPIFEMNQLVRW